MYPIALEVFEICDVPKKFILGVLAAGSFTFLQSMPAEYQEIVLNAVTEACDWAKTDIETKTATFKQALIDEGHTFIEIDFAEWASAAKDGIMKAAEVSCDDAKAVLAKYVG